MESPTNTPPAASHAKHVRRQKLIAPGLQLRLVGSFAGIAVLAMLLQYVLLAFQLTRGVSALGPHGGELAEAVPGLLLKVLALTAFVVVPLIFLVGVSLTHRFAGPVYRFEGFLKGVAAGEVSGPVTLRDKDEMLELAQLINEATEEKRRENAGAKDSGAKDSGAQVSDADDAPIRSVA